MKLIFAIFSIAQMIFVWASLVFAIVILGKAISKIAKDRKIFNNQSFELVSGVVFWLVLIISTQWAKYEDRKAGKRWWTQ